MSPGCFSILLKIIILMEPRASGKLRDLSPDLLDRDLERRRRRRLRLRRDGERLLPRDRSLLPSRPSRSRPADTARRPSWEPRDSPIAATLAAMDSARCLRRDRDRSLS